MGYKPYFIFNDRTLDELVLRKPKNYDELRLIEGIAEKKVRKYGSDILAIINGKK